MEKIELDNLEQEEQIDFKSMLDSSFIDVEKKIDRQPVAIGIGHYNYGQNTYPIPFGSYGDFSCIVGASKSKKTFLKSALIAGYIGGQSSRYFPDINGYNQEKKYIIDLDTEQSQFHVQRVAKRVCDMVGSNYEYYKPFKLRGLSFKTKLDLINWIIKDSEYAGKIGLLCIDGIADLVDDVNDLKQSNKVVECIDDWIVNNNFHLITVLHRNFGSMKPTGHLGSAVLKKAETVAFVERVDDVTKVTCEYSRNMPFDEFSFTVNQQFLPTVNNFINSEDLF